MARKPGPGICVHCLKNVQKRNWDHVFPLGWYPDTTPQNTEKWKIPTCKPCNDEYGQIEDELGTILSACIDPRTAHASGIWRKTLRSLDPLQGKTEKDRKAREKKQKCFFDKILRGDQIPNNGIYPGLGERWGRNPAERIALIVPARHLEKLLKKIIKGIAFLEDGRLIDASTEIEHHVIEPAGAVAREIEAILERFGKIHSREPGNKLPRPKGRGIRRRRSVGLRVVWCTRYLGS